MYLNYGDKERVVRGYVSFFFILFLDFVFYFRNYFML